MTASTKTLLLDHYHCTFFLPLIGVKNTDFQPNPELAWIYPANDTLEKVLAEARAADEEITNLSATPEEIGRAQDVKTGEVEAQAYRFFFPAIRNILFDCGSDRSRAEDPRPVKEWRIPPEALESWELHLGKEEDKEESDPLKYQKASITSVTLYRYFNGIYLLAFRVEPAALTVLRDEHAPRQRRYDEALKRSKYNERTRKSESKEASQPRKKEMASEKIREEKRLAQLEKEAAHPFFSNDAPNHFLEMANLDPSRKELYEQLQLERWLHFTRLARLIYPSFPQQNDEEKIAPIRLIIGQREITAFDELQKVAILKKPGEDISPVIRRILEEFATVPKTVKPFLDGYSKLYDDRMFVSVAYSLAGKQLPPEQLKKLFYLALYVDRHEDTSVDMDGHAYTPEVLERLSRDRSFDLWNGLGGYYGYTEFSNAYLSRGWSFRTFIAPEHVPYIYDRMLIQALFYQASLRYYDEIICQETRKMLKKNDLKSIRKQREEFIRFTNRYWFHNLTEQMQGKKIFKLQQEGLGLKEHYGIIKDELERTDEYLQTEHEIRISKLSEFFTLWGLVIALIALYYTALPLMLDYIKEVKGISLWKLIGNGVVPLGILDETRQQLAGIVLALLGIPCVIAITVIGIKKLIRCWRRG